MSDKPDPSEVEAVTKTEGVYQRDEKGKLQPTDWKVIEFGGEYRKVRPYPIPTGEFQKFEKMGENVELERLSEILAEKYETPDRTVEEWNDTDPEMYYACVNLLVELATGETASSNFHEEVQEELEQRSDAGN